MKFSSWFHVELVCFIGFLVTSVQKIPQSPISKSMRPYSFVPYFSKFKQYLNSLVKINKMVKENTVNNQPSPSGLTSMDTPSHISIDPLDFVSLRNLWCSDYWKLHSWLMPPAKLSPRFLFSPPPPHLRPKGVHSFPSGRVFRRSISSSMAEGGEEIMHLYIFCLTDFQYAIIGYKGW